MLFLFGRPTPTPPTEGNFRSRTAKHYSLIAAADHRSLTIIYYLPPRPYALLTRGEF
ncbi:MAG: hypothetical protein LBP62_07725 [Clostridiales bacterium]|nr:hypothetical protein [Clostridiales bacterium]